jgi:type IV pilus assembly protein PilA
MKKSGFTLIEMLVVITILSIFAVIVYAALNPAQRIKDSKDAKRSSDIDTILTAVHEYIIDNRGTLPSGLSTTEQQIGTMSTGCTINGGAGRCNTGSNSCYDLASAIPGYIASNPIDPKTGASSSATGYTIVSTSTGIVTIKACNTDTSTMIQASR